MKWMIGSDIHGSAYYCRKLFEAWEKEKPEKLILLGDLLYHGARNSLPKEYAPMEVAAMLNAHKEDIVCVRGNCDAEVDQMVLEFPIMADYALLQADGILIFATHGHLYNKENPPHLKKGDVLLQGHTHLYGGETLEGGWSLVNPGSVSLPQGGRENSYLIYEDACFFWKDMDGNEMEQFFTKVE